MVHEAKSFLLVCTQKGAFGVGASLVEAAKNLKRQTTFQRGDVVTAVAFTCEREKIKLTADVSLTYEFPQDATAIKFNYSM